jgi:rhodanese-related sulfurtransferase
MLTHMTRILIVLGVSTAVAVGVAQQRKLPWLPDMKKVEQKQEAARRSEELRRQFGIDLATFQELIAANAVVIDARPASEFEKGHLLVQSYPPTLNVDAERAAAQFERLSQLQGQTIVVYCTSLDCHFAEELIIELETLGFDVSTMKIYPEGWEGIQKAGLPTAAGPDSWTGYGELSDPDPAAQPADEPATGEETDGEMPPADDGTPGANGDGDGADGDGQ